MNNLTAFAIRNTTTVYVLVVLMVLYGITAYFGLPKQQDPGFTIRAAVVTTQVMPGPWTPAMKAELFHDIEAVIRDATKMPRTDPGSDFWMTITEVPEGGWGYGGSPVSIAALAPAFTEDRQHRIRAYLDGR